MSSPYFWVDPSGLQETFPVSPPDPGQPPTPGLPPGADSWECKGSVKGPQKTYWLWSDTCCKVQIRLNVILTRCFRPGWIGGPVPATLPGETPEENDRRWARNFYTKVQIKKEILGSDPSGCAARGRPEEFEACSVFPGRYISSLGGNWPPNSVPDLDEKGVQDGISEFGESACDVVRNHPWGTTT